MPLISFLDAVKTPGLQLRGKCTDCASKGMCVGKETVNE